MGAITSAERGNLVTVCVAINATGNCLPPMFLFPRKIFRDDFLRGGPVGCIGAANGSGWMQGDAFLKFIKHFAKHAKPSRENKVLLLLDNHESHIYLPTIEFCRDNGIVLLSFPPHCSHRLQPLDVGVYGPFKRYVNSAMDSWMKCHPGKRMTIYNSCHCAATPKNIMSGFSATGIWPFNEHIFQDSDFTPCQVTDRPNPENDPQSPNQLSNEPSTSAATVSPDASSFSPEVVRPSPKAIDVIDTCSKRPARKRGKSSILTNTPEKLALEEVANKRQSKVVPKQSSSRGKGGKLARQRLSFIEEDSDDCNEYFCLVCLDNYTNSRPREEWVQCITCRKWAHVKCTKGEKNYECPNCFSD